MYPTHYIDNILLFVVILSCPFPSSFRDLRQNYLDSSENCFVLIRTIQLLTVLNHLFPWFEAIKVRILYEEWRHVPLYVLMKENSKLEFTFDRWGIYLEGDGKVGKRTIDRRFIQKRRVLFRGRSTGVLINQGRIVHTNYLLFILRITRILQQQRQSPHPCYLTHVLSFLFLRWVLQGLGGPYVLLHSIEPSNISHRNNYNNSYKMETLK